MLLLRVFLLTVSPCCVMPWSWWWPFKDKKEDTPVEHVTNTSSPDTEGTIYTHQPSNFTINPETTEVYENSEENISSTTDTSGKFATNDSEGIRTREQQLDKLLEKTKSSPLGHKETTAVESFNFNSTEPSGVDLRESVMVEGHTQYIGKTSYAFKEAATTLSSASDAELSAPGVSTSKSIITSSNRDDTDHGVTEKLDILKRKPSVPEETKTFLLPSLQILVSTIGPDDSLITKKGKMLKGNTSLEYDLNTEKISRISDMDECSRLTGRCQMLCFNTKGSYYCGCNPGFVLNNDNHSCTDIDECDTLNTKCQMRCINTEGSYHCGCDPGFILTDDEYSCTDVDECSILNGMCEMLCVNTEGSYHCDCDPGFVLTNDKHSCTDFNECHNEKAHNCTAGHSCVNTYGSYVCLLTEKPRNGTLRRRTLLRHEVILGLVIWMGVLTGLLVVCIALLCIDAGESEDISYAFSSFIPKVYNHYTSETPYGNSSQDDLSYDLPFSQEYQDMQPRMSIDMPNDIMRQHRTSIMKPPILRSIQRSLYRTAVDNNHRISNSGRPAQPDFRTTRYQSRNSTTSHGAHSGSLHRHTPNESQSRNNTNQNTPMTLPYDSASRNSRRGSSAYLELGTHRRSSTASARMESGLSTPTFRLPITLPAVIREE